MLKKSANTAKLQKKNRATEIPQGHVRSNLFHQKKINSNILIQFQIKVNIWTMNELLRGNDFRQKLDVAIGNAVNHCEINSFVSSSKYDILWSWMISSRVKYG